MAGIDLKDRVTHRDRHCAAGACSEKQLNTVVCYGEIRNECEILLDKLRGKLCGW